MILAVDVDYRETGGFVAGVLFENWSDQVPYKKLSLKIDQVEEYIPGQFYRRELPCIKVLLENMDLKLDCIVVDGYVYLGKEKKAGLGKYLYQELEENIPIIGVAKHFFKDTPKSTEVYRGKSTRPIYVTVEGMNDHTARELIQNMHGEYRIPTLLKLVDRFCRDAL